MTAQLAQRAFILEELGLHELKGVAEPMPLFRVVAPREIEPNYEGLTASGFEALVDGTKKLGS